MIFQIPFKSTPPLRSGNCWSGLYHHELIFSVLSIVWVKSHSVYSFVSDCCVIHCVSTCVSSSLLGKFPPLFFLWMFKCLGQVIQVRSAGTGLGSGLCDPDSVPSLSCCFPEAGDRKGWWCRNGSTLQVVLGNWYFIPFVWVLHYSPMIIWDCEVQQSISLLQKKNVHFSISGLFIKLTPWLRYCSSSLLTPSPGYGVIWLDVHLGNLTLNVGICKRFPWAGHINIPREDAVCLLPREW